MQKKFCSILAVMLSAVIGFTGISASAAFNADMDVALEVSQKKMSTEAENKEVYFYYETMEESDGFKLFENGVEVGTFVDDGKYSVSGDDMMGDGVYTLKYSIDTDTIPDGSNYFDNVYHVQNGNTIVSEDETISVYKPFTQQELDDMAYVDGEIKKLTESEEYTSASLDERKILVTELLNSLAEQGLVKSDFSFNYKLAEFEYSCGVEGVIMLKGWDEYDEPIDSPAVTTAVTTKQTETTTTVPQIITLPIITMATTASMPLSGNCFYTEDKEIIADDVSAFAGDTVSAPFEFEDFAGEPVILDVSGSADLEIIGVYLEDGTEVKKSGSGAYEVTEAKGYVKIKVSETVTDSNCALWLNGEARKSVSGTNIIYVYKYSKKINVNALKTAVTTAVTTMPAEATATLPQITVIATLPITTVMDGEPARAMWIVNEPDKLTYNIGEELDLTGLTVSVGAYGGYNDSYSEEIYSNVNPLDYPDVFTIDTSEFDNTKAGTYKIWVKDNNGYGFAQHSDYFKVTVEDEVEAVTTSVTTEQTGTTTTTATTTAPITTITTTTAETTQTLGDANGDNKVDVRDCAFIASALAKGEVSKLPKSADFNGDGKINVRDAAAIAAMLAKKNSVEDWKYAYNSLINEKTSKTERNYGLIYIDEDDVPELIVSDFADIRDGGVYTYKNGILNKLEGITLRNDIDGYSEKTGNFEMAWTWLEKSGYNFYKLENGAIECVHELVSEFNAEAEAKGFTADGENVTEEEYNRLYEEYSANFKEVEYCGYDEVQNQLN